jgi:hypothetical protein
MIMATDRPTHYAIWATVTCDPVVLLLEAVLKNGGPATVCGQRAFAPSSEFEAEYIPDEH